MWPAMKSSCMQSVNKPKFNQNDKNYQSAKCTHMQKSAMAQSTLQDE